MYSPPILEQLCFLIQIGLFSSSSFTSRICNADVFSPAVCSCFSSMTLAASNSYVTKSGVFCSSRLTVLSLGGSGRGNGLSVRLELSQLYCRLQSYDGLLRLLREMLLPLYKTELASSGVL